MPLKSLATKDVPWCLLILVALSTTCHIFVFLGNNATARGLETIGQSTKGWSGVGLGISHSLQNELDVVMTNMSTGLIQAIKHTMHTSEILNTVAAMAGMAADHAASSDAAKAIALLQQQAALAGTPSSVLPGLLTSSVDKMLHKLLRKAIDALDVLMKELKPVLEEVGKFIHKFGDKVQTVIEGFSVTLDHVQKLFDQVMAFLSGHGDGEEEMRLQTFALFDVSNTGFVNKQDLKDVARLYDLSAFRGSKSDELVDKYDGDRDGRLNKAEFKLFVHDSSLPNAMSVILRSYSKRLVEVAGNVAAARQRDEVAQQVVKYLELVCAKNATKMAWVADALADGNLPLEFTADVMGELALAMDDPGLLTKVDVGGMVVRRMFSVHPDNTQKAFALMRKATFWVAEGFHSSEHPVCIQRVAVWISAAGGVNALLEVMDQKDQLSLLQTADNATKKDTVDIVAMHDLFLKTGEQDMKAHIDSKDALEERAYAQMFQSKSSRLMLAHLLGGTLALAGTGSEGARVVKAGQPARPETLRFAQLLASSATRTSQHFQSMCFKYSKTSSNAVDSFATQIQGMVKKVQGFIKMMERYSTPAGIEQLELQVHNFAATAGKDVLKIITKNFGAVVNKNAPVIEGALDKAVSDIGNLTKSIASSLETPLGQALAPVLESIVKQIASDNSTGTHSRSHQIAKELAKILGKEILHMSGDVLGNEVGKLLHKMINSAASKAGTLLNSTGKMALGLDQMDEHFADDVPLEHVMAGLNEYVALHHTFATAPEIVSHTASLAGHENKEGILLQLGTDQESNDVLSGVWSEMVTLLRSMSNVLPQATKTLKFARLEVSKLAANLDSIFNPFEVTGPQIFNEISRLYRQVWALYFCVVLPLTCALVSYGFWAGGFFGGPGSGQLEETEEDDNTSEDGFYDEKGMRWKFTTCCRACCHCCRGCHDWSLSFWSFLLVMQVVVTLIFVVALVLLALGSVKAFISSGCQQLYTLGDPLICGQTLQALRSFLSTFKAEWVLAEMPQTCVREDLLVCRSISNELQTSAKLTVVFGFLAAVLSFQQLVESSILHTRAVWRRKAIRHFNGLDKQQDLKLQEETHAGISSTSSS